MPILDGRVGGLLGLALRPDFADTRSVVLYQHTGTPETPCRGSLSDAWTKAIPDVRGGVVATLGLPHSLLANQGETVEMKGTARGEHVWFAPAGLAVSPGTTVRFVNRDPANSHTTTAYHSEIFDRQQRIPLGAATWDSDFLLPDEAFVGALATGRFRQ